ncbi:hypothetical protein [Sporisorium scitamineum]|uniref:Uncharacterized protein n=1 Tax=Sporisorium scitamineum TaxID=49012 RepID=A0A0F7S0Y9_9BASI|nr:hypothetical protein [Sporisorium scitamineum]
MAPSDSFFAKETDVVPRKPGVGSVRACVVALLIEHTRLGFARVPRTLAPSAR